MTGLSKNELNGQFTLILNNDNINNQLNFIMQSFTNENSSSENLNNSTKQP